MNELFPKFIVEGDCLIIAKCTYHKDIVNNRDNVKGGGWWRLDKDTDTFILSGTSYDFGKASIEDIRECVIKGNVFTNSSHTHSIADFYNFSYFTGSETINLKHL